MDRDELLRDQLKHAHSLNALVDNHRFSLLQLLFTFHGIVLSALIFKADMPPNMTASSLLAIWLSVGVAAIGTGLFGVFLSQHRYMRSYKSWIATLEGQLHRLGGSNVAAHKGTLSWDENQPKIKAEGTFLLLVIVFLVLNIGVSAAVALRLGTAYYSVAIMSLVVLCFHVLVAWVVLCTPTNTRTAITEPKVPQSTDPDKNHYYGNAISDSIDHRGWFIGSFMTDRSPLLQSKHVEVKWGIHRSGEARSDWDAGNPSFSLTILLRGHLVQIFADAEFNLTNEGDFVAWRPGVPHTWRAEKDSVILTVRWPGT